MTGLEVTILGWESIIRESADFTLLIIGNPGALVTFFNYIPGLLFPKKIM